VKGSRGRENAEYIKFLNRRRLKAEKTLIKKNEKRDIRNVVWVPLGTEMVTVPSQKIIMDGIRIFYFILFLNFGQMILIRGVKMIYLE